MQALESLQFSALMQKSSNHTTLIEVESVKFPHHSPSAEHENVDPPLILLFVPMCLMLIWVFVLFILSRCSDAEQNKGEKVISNPIQQAPCKKCQYFTNNHYLQCAVHPSVALTEAALNCSDYCPKQQK